MTLSERLHLNGSHQVISIIGSGGKTSLLYALAREYAACNLRVGVTTTTHIMRPNEPDFFVSDTGNSFAENLSTGKIIAVGTPAPNGKLSAPDPCAMESLRMHTDVLLIEADGSKCLPIKFPNASEPVILPQTTSVIAVAGLSALGKPLEKVCHRWELAAKQLGISPDQTVTPEIIAELLRIGYGAFCPTVLLNQADTPERIRQGELIAKLLKNGEIKTVYTISLKQEVKSIC